MTEKKKPDNRTHAQKRRAEQQEAIRARFKGLEYARQLDECYKAYGELLNELSILKVKKAKLKKSETEQLAQIRSFLEICNAKKDIIKGKIDLNLRRLKFVLPELKSIELSDPNGDNPFQSFTEMLIDATKKQFK